MADRIHQEIVVASPPGRVYEALTDGAQFSQLSGGAPAEIDAAPGGAFSCFGGMIRGRTIEAAPGRLLIQAWRAESWDPGVYSIVRFELTAEGGGTRVVLDHTGFPAEQGEHLAQGWQANYWEPLQQLSA